MGRLLSASQSSAGVLLAQHASCFVFHFSCPFDDSSLHKLRTYHSYHLISYHIILIYSYVLTTNVRTFFVHLETHAFGCLQNLRELDLVGLTLELKIAVQPCNILSLSMSLSMSNHVQPLIPSWAIPLIRCASESVPLYISCIRTNSNSEQTPSLNSFLKLFP